MLVEERGLPAAKQAQHGDASNNTQTVSSQVVASRIARSMPSTPARSAKPRLDKIQPAKAVKVAAAFAPNSAGKPATAKPQYKVTTAEHQPTQKLSAESASQSAMAKASSDQPSKHVDVSKGVGSVATANRAASQGEVSSPTSTTSSSSSDTSSSNSSSSNSSSSSDTDSSVSSRSRGHGNSADTRPQLLSASGQGKTVSRSRSRRRSRSRSSYKPHSQEHKAKVHRRRRSRSRGCSYSHSRSHSRSRSGSRRRHRGRSYSRSRSRQGHRQCQQKRSYSRSSNSRSRSRSRDRGRCAAGNSRYSRPEFARPHFQDRRHLPNNNSQRHTGSYRRGTATYAARGGFGSQHRSSNGSCRYHDRDRHRSTSRDRQRSRSRNTQRRSPDEQGRDYRRRGSRSRGRSRQRQQQQCRSSSRSPVRRQQQQHNRQSSRSPPRRSVFQRLGSPEPRANGKGEQLDNSSVAEKLKGSSSKGQQQLPPGSTSGDRRRSVFDRLSVQRPTAKQPLLPHPQQAAGTANTEEASERLVAGSAATPAAATGKEAVDAQQDIPHSTAGKDEQRSLHADGAQRKQLACQQNEQQQQQEPRSTAADSITPAAAAGKQAPETQQKGSVSAVGKDEQSSLQHNEAQQQQQKQKRQHPQQAAEVGERQVASSTPTAGSGAGSITPVAVARTQAAETQQGGAPSAVSKNEQRSLYAEGAQREQISCQHSEQQQEEEQEEEEDHSSATDGDVAVSVTDELTALWQQLSQEQQTQQQPVKATSAAADVAKSITPTKCKGGADGQQQEIQEQQPQQQQQVQEPQQQQKQQQDQEPQQQQKQEQVQKPQPQQKQQQVQEPQQQQKQLQVQEPQQQQKQQQVQEPQQQQKQQQDQEPQQQQQQQQVQELQQQKQKQQQPVKAASAAAVTAKSITPAKVGHSKSGADDQQQQVQEQQQQQQQQPTQHLQAPGTALKPAKQDGKQSPAEAADGANIPCHQASPSKPSVSDAAAAAAVAQEHAVVQQPHGHSKNDNDSLPLVVAAASATAVDKLASNTKQDEQQPAAAAAAGAVTSREHSTAQARQPGIGEGNIQQQQQQQPSKDSSSRLQSRDTSRDHSRNVSRDGARGTSRDPSRSGTWVSSRERPVSRWDRPAAHSRGRQPQDDHRDGQHRDSGRETERPAAAATTTGGGTRHWQDRNHSRGYTRDNSRERERPAAAVGGGERSQRGRDSGRDHPRDRTRESERLAACAAVAGAGEQHQQDRDSSKDHRRGRKQESEAPRPASWAPAADRAVVQSSRVDNAKRSDTVQHSSPSCEEKPSNSRDRLLPLQQHLSSSMEQQQIRRSASADRPAGSSGRFQQQRSRLRIVDGPAASFYQAQQQQRTQSGPVDRPALSSDKMQPPQRTRSEPVHRPAASFDQAQQQQQQRTPSGSVDRLAASSDKAQQQQQQQQCTQSGSVDRPLPDRLQQQQKRTRSGSIDRPTSSFDQVQQQQQQGAVAQRPDSHERSAGAKRSDSSRSHPYDWPSKPDQGAEVGQPQQYNWPKPQPSNSEPNGRYGWTKPNHGSKQQQYDSHRGYSQPNGRRYEAQRARQYARPGPGTRYDSPSRLIKQDSWDRHQCDKYQPGIRTRQRQFDRSRSGSLDPRDSDGSIASDLHRQLPGRYRQDDDVQRMQPDSRGTGRQDSQCRLSVGADGDEGHLLQQQQVLQQQQEQLAQQLLQQDSCQQQQQQQLPQPEGPRQHAAGGTVGPADTPAAAAAAISLMQQQPLKLGQPAEAVTPEDQQQQQRSALPTQQQPQQGQPEQQGQPQQKHRQLGAVEDKRPSGTDVQQATHKPGAAAADQQKQQQGPQQQEVAAITSPSPSKPGGSRPGLVIKIGANRPSASTASPSPAAAAAAAPAASLSSPAAAAGVSIPGLAASPVAVNLPGSGAAAVGRPHGHIWSPPAAAVDRVHQQAVVSPSVRRQLASPGNSGGLTHHPQEQWQQLVPDAGQRALAAAEQSMSEALSQCRAGLQPVMIAYEQLKAAKQELAEEQARTHRVLQRATERCWVFALQHIDGSLVWDNGPDEELYLLQEIQDMFPTGFDAEGHFVQLCFDGGETLDLPEPLYHHPTWPPLTSTDQEWQGQERLSHWQMISLAEAQQYCCYDTQGDEQQRQQQHVVERHLVLLLQTMSQLRAAVHKLAQSTAAQQSAQVHAGPWTWINDPWQHHYSSSSSNSMPWQQLLQLITERSVCQQYDPSQIIIEQHTPGVQPVQTTLLCVQQTIQSSERHVATLHTGFLDVRQILTELPPFEDCTACWVLPDQAAAAAVSIDQLRIYVHQGVVSPFHLAAHVSDSSKLVWVLDLVMLRVVDRQYGDMQQDQPNQQQQQWYQQQQQQQWQPWQAAATLQSPLRQGGRQQQQRSLQSPTASLQLRQRQAPYGSAQQQPYSNVLQRQQQSPHTSSQQQQPHRQPIPQGLQLRQQLSPQARLQQQQQHAHIQQQSLHGKQPHSRQQQQQSPVVLLHQQQQQASSPVSGAADVVSKTPSPEGPPAPPTPPVDEPAAATTATAATAAVPTAPTAAAVQEAPTTPTATAAAASPLVLPSPQSHHNPSSILAVSFPAAVAAPFLWPPMAARARRVLRNIFQGCDEEWDALPDDPGNEAQIAAAAAAAATTNAQNEGVAAAGADSVAADQLAAEGAAASAATAAAEQVAADVEHVSQLTDHQQQQLSMEADGHQPVTDSTACGVAVPADGLELLAGSSSRSSSRAKGRITRRQHKQSAAAVEQCMSALDPGTTAAAVKEAMFGVRRSSRGTDLSTSQQQQQQQSRKRRSADAVATAEGAGRQVRNRSGSAAPSDSAAASTAAAAAAEDSEAFAVSSSAGSMPSAPAAAAEGPAAVEGPAATADADGSATAVQQQLQALAEADIDDKTKAEIQAIILGSGRPNRSQRKQKQQPATPTAAEAEAFAASVDSQQAVAKQHQQRQQQAGAKRSASASSIQTAAAGSSKPAKKPRKAKAAVPLRLCARSMPVDQLRAKAAEKKKQGYCKGMYLAYQARKKRLDAAQAAADLPIDDQGMYLAMPHSLPISLLDYDPRHIPKKPQTSAAAAAPSGSSGSSIRGRGGRSTLRGDQALVPTALKSKSQKSVFQRSGVHGWGLFAGAEINPEEFIIEYVGELIRPMLEDVRHKYYESQGQDSSYLFRIDKEWIADATVRGGQARFINHSCDPNCYTKIFEEDGRRKIGIYAKTKIAQGQELAYDYKFEFEEGERKVPCACGAKNCRKFMN